MRQHRREGVMPLHEYRVRARELAVRGDAHPATKLTEAQVAEIRRLAEVRAAARAAITRDWSNAAIAARFGVHRRTVEKVLSGERIR